MYPDTQQNRLPLLQDTCSFVSSCFEVSLSTFAPWNVGRTSFVLIMFTRNTYFYHSMCGWLKVVTVETVLVVRYLLLYYNLTFITNSVYRLLCDIFLSTACIMINMFKGNNVWSL